MYIVSHLHPLAQPHQPSHTRLTVTHFSRFRTHLDNSLLLYVVLVLYHLLLLLALLIPRAHHLVNLALRRLLVLLLIFLLTLSRDPLVPLLNLRLALQLRCDEKVGG